VTFVYCFNNGSTFGGISGVLNSNDSENDKGLSRALLRTCFDVHLLRELGRGDMLGSPPTY
jgi:hypothetical protein